MDDPISEYRQDISEAITSASPDDLVCSNLALVLYLVNRFYSSNKSVRFDDLVGAGNLALCKAAKHFDTEKKIKFSTYAATIINREFLKLMVEEANRGCRIPKKTFEQSKIVAAYVEIHDILPSLAELEPLLCRKIKLGLARYNHIINAYQSTRSFASEILDSHCQTDDPSVSIDERIDEESFYDEC